MARRADVVFTLPLAIAIITDNMFTSEELAIFIDD